MLHSHFFLPKNHEQGQTIIEAIIALSVLVIVIAGITVSIIAGVNNTTFIKNQNLASKSAQEALERIRNAKDNNTALTVNGAPLGFKNITSGLYCMGEDGSLTSTAGCNVDSSTGLIREVAVETNSSSCTAGSTIETKITVTVRWSSAKCGTGSITERYCHTSVITTCAGVSVASTPGL